MAAFENVAGRPEIDFVLVYLAGSQQLLLRLAGAIAGADDAVGQVGDTAARADVDQFGGPVGVDGGRGREERDLDRPGHFGVLLEGWGGVDEDIRALLDSPLILDAAVAPDLIAAELAAGSGDGIERIVDEVIGSLGRAGFITGELAVAVESVGVAIGVQVKAGEFGAGEGPFVFESPAVLAHDEDADGWFGVQTVVDIAEVTIEEAEVDAIEIDIGVPAAHAGIVGTDRGGVADGHVIPRTDEEALVCAGGAGFGSIAHAVVGTQRAAEEDVVPGAGVHDGEIELVVIAVDPYRVPERSVIGIGKPFIPVRRDFFEQRISGEWHDVEVGIHGVAAVPEGFEAGLPGRIGLGTAPGGVGGEIRKDPALDEIELERASLITPALVVVGGSDIGDDRLESGGSGEGRLPLGETDIRRPKHADATVRPGLGADPLAGVVTVALFVGEGVELAFGIVAAADVEEEDGVPLSGGANGKSGVCDAAVGGALEDDRIASRGGGEIEIGDQVDAIAHGDANAGFDGNGERSGHRWRLPDMAADRLRDDRIPSESRLEFASACKGENVWAALGHMRYAPAASLQKFIRGG